MPAKPGQVVGDRCAAHTAAYDHAAGGTRQLAPAAQRRAASTQVLKRGVGARLRQPVEVLGRVAAEVVVELRYGRLDDAPHRLAEVRYEAVQLQRGAPAIIGRAAEVDGEQALLLLVAELVVDGEVAEVEVAIAHAGVLPVDDVDALPVQHEVRGQQVVVAGDGCVLGALPDGPLHRSGALAHRLEPLGQLDPMLRPDPRIPLDELERVELRREHRARAVESLEARGDRLDGVRPAQFLRRHHAAGDEGGDEAGRAVEHRVATVGAIPSCAAAFVAKPLGLTVDAEHVRPLPGQAHHVVGAAEVHAVVAVGDPALELGHAALARAEQGREASHDLGQLGDRDLLVHGRTTRTRALRAPPPTTRVRCRRRRTDPAPYPIVQRLPRADRDHGAGDRIAAVLEQHERARHVAPRAKAVEHRQPRHGFRPRCVPVGLGPAPDVEHGRRAGQPRPRRGGVRTDRPAPPARDQLAQLGRRLLADEHVQPVSARHARRPARQDGLALAHDHVDECLAGQLELAGPQPDDGVVVVDRVFDHLGAEPADRAGLGDRAGEGRNLGRQPEPARERLEGRSLQERREQHGEEDDVQELEPLPDPRIHREQREHDRHGAAQPSPAEHGPLREREALEGGGGEGGQRAGNERDHEREHRALQRHVQHVAREDQEPEGEEHRELRHPGEAHVEGRDGLLGGNVRAPERQPDQVDGEEARPLDRRGRAVRDRPGRQRGHRVEAGGVEPGAPEPLHGEPADSQADHRADPQLLHEQPEHVEHAVVRQLDPVDEAEDEQDGHGIVEAGLALERRRQPPLERRGAQHGEDRRAVRGGDDRAEQQRLQEGEVEQQHRHAAPDRRRQQRPDHAPG